MGEILIIKSDCLQVSANLKKLIHLYPPLKVWANVCFTDFCISPTSSINYFNNFWKIEIYRNNVADNYSQL